MDEGSLISTKELDDLARNILESVGQTSQYDQVTRLYNLAKFYYTAAVKTEQAYMGIEGPNHPSDFSLQNVEEYKNILKAVCPFNCFPN